MNILQINCTWKEGSTGKIVYDIHTGLLRDGFASEVCYGRGTLVHEPYVTKLCSNYYGKANNLRSRLTGLMYGGCILSTNRLIQYIRRIKPDVVHLHCINGYFVNIYRLIGFLKEQKIPTVLTLHAEFMYTANCGHSLDCDGWLHGCGNCPRLRQETLSWFLDRTADSFQRMRKAFEGFQNNLIVVSVSDWLMERAKKSLILGDMDHRVIYNGVNTQVFAPISRQVARTKLGLPNGKILFHATAMFSDQPGHLKGGQYIIELAKRLKKENVLIVVAGKQKISSKLPDNLLYVGQILDQKLLAAYYNAADLTVIASQKETFSMICAESLCCGTPVVGFKAGAPEQISLKQYSEFVPYADLDALERCIQRWIKKDFSLKEITKQAEAMYSQDSMFKHYLSVYQEMTNG